MPGCQADPSIERVAVEGFTFPLGVYPVEPLKPRPGYCVNFEPADGGEGEGDWEEWPDRYVYDIVASAQHVQPLFRHLLTLLPLRVFPILDVLGHDAYREIDPFISYEPIGLDRLMDATREWKDFFYEDGLCGFGAMSEEPFTYVFLDEHKILTVRVEPEYKESVEKLLQAFELEQLEDPAGADAAAHEHRGVLVTPDDRPDLLGPEEIVERLRDEWRLVLNVDPDTNVDEEGHELGQTPWRCVVRCDWIDEEKPEELPKRRYAEVLLEAKSLRAAEDLAVEAAEDLLKSGEPGFDDAAVVAADRLTPELLAECVGKPKKRKALPPAEGPVRTARWME